MESEQNAMAEIKKKYEEMRQRLCSNSEGPVIELIEWIQTAKELPDEDLTVMVVVDGSSEVLLGSLNDAKWYYESGFRISAKVTHWAEMPIGPTV
jgi:hypothetical protein